MGIERALISVSDKTGIIEFARELAGLGIEIVSTGGTARLLRESSIKVKDVAELTGWPEMLGGRVKTLHPKVHGGILFRRDVPEDRLQAAQHAMAPIDLVVVNLYPFAAVAERPHVTSDELIENIDIGGPAMIRSAAKNFASVAVVTDPADYPVIIQELKASRELTAVRRLMLGWKAFAATARYDAKIATELQRLSLDSSGIVISGCPVFPSPLFFSLEKRQALRYGENPHQRGALYVPAGHEPAGLAGAPQIQGKELSYNNFVDLDAAWSLVEEFREPSVAIVKHSNPCGVAEQCSLVDAYERALECDPLSAFGSVLAFNRPLDAATAKEVAKLFVECIAAPGYDPTAIAVFGAKKNLRLLQMPVAAAPAELELKRISGGVLVQEPDRRMTSENDWKVVTERPPSDTERRAMVFAWKVVKHVKSNAIVFAKGGQTLGVGAGQMSRVDSVKLAVMKADTAKLSLAGTVVASEAFFPFPDGIVEAGKAGATAVIQPGGSVRDAEVIAAANRLGMAMVFTGVRHFRH